MKKLKGLKAQAEWMTRATRAKDLGSIIATQPGARGFINYFKGHKLYAGNEQLMGWLRQAV